MFNLINPYAHGKFVGAVFNSATEVGSGTLSNDDRDYAVADNSGVESTIGMTTGKYYWQFKIISGYLIIAGVAESTYTLGDDSLSDANAWVVYPGTNYHHNSSFFASGFGQWIVGDVVDVAYNADTGKLWFGENGTWYNSGDPDAGTGETYSGLSGTVYPTVSMAGTGYSGTVRFNALEEDFSGSKPANASTFLELKEIG